MVKARRRKAAPAPPVAMSVWQDNYRGIKQQDLTSEEDLLHADVFDLNTAQLPHDPVLNRTGPHVNAIFVLILQSYREFLSSLPCEITHGESVKVGAIGLFHCYLSKCFPSVMCAPGLSRYMW